MPDYGDDRGFRMNVPQRVVRPNIGFDRAGPGTNYNEGYGRVQNPAVSFSSQQGGPSNEYSRRPMGRGRFEGRPFGPPPNIGADRAGGFGFGPRGASRGDDLLQDPTPMMGGTDMMADYYNNQLDWADQLQSDIGGAGEVIPAGYQEHDKAYRQFWTEANRTVRAQVGDAAADANNQSLVRQQWEKLKQIYHNKIATGGKSGTIGQKIKNIGKFAGKYGKIGGPLGMLSGFGYLADVLSPSNIMGFKDPDIEPGTYDPGAQMGLRRGGIASLIRRL